MQPLQIYAFADEAGASLDAQLAALRRNGLRGLEVRGVDGENVSDLSLEKAREVRKRLEDAGMTAWATGSPIGKIDIAGDFPAHMDKLRHTIDVTRALGARNLRMFSFYLPAGEDPALYRDEVMDRLRRMAEAARGSGVTLCHENEKGIYGDSAERCLDVLLSVPEIVGVFDPANFIQCGQDTAEAWAMLKPYTRYMHVKDALPDGRVVPAGCGAGHVTEILADYLAAGGRALTLEPHLSVFDGLATLERRGGQNRTAFVYDSSDAAFDAAAEALRKLLSKINATPGEEG